MSIIHRSAAASIALLTGAALAIAVPMSASAHVTLAQNTAEPNSYTTLTFKVPNESESAFTDSVTVHLPTDTPIVSVRYVPVPGWSAQLVRETLPAPVEVGGNTITEAVTSVVWTATDGVGVPDGALQTFTISAGPIPDTGSIAFPVEQGYSDGSVVAWDEDGESAEHPAPVLYVNDQPEADHHGGAADSDEEHAMASPADAEPDVLARVLGTGGLVLGLVALVAVLATRRRRA